VRELWPLAFGSLAGVCGPCVGISGRLEIGVAPWRSGLVLTMHFGLGVPMRLRLAVSSNNR
jgi:hypothetical protein